MSSIKIYQVLILLSFLLIDCATIMNGTRQAVSISSNPPGATVIINGIRSGKTPIFRRLPRKDDQFIRLELEGFLPYEELLIKETSGWVWGNIIFGGLIGLAIDMASGGMYKLNPDFVYGYLEKSGASYMIDDNHIFVVVVLNPDPTWEKIGNMSRD
jgi:hypothetical protein